MGYNEFQKQLEEAVDFFSSFDKNGQVRLISHHDADGICSAAIIIELLDKLNFNYCISVVPQLDDDFLQSLSREDYCQFIFADLGSVFIEKISEQLDGRKVLILDHHQVNKSAGNKNVCHVNPHLHGIQGSREISGSGVVYMFSELFCDVSNLSHLPIVGAIGDAQANKGLKGLNKIILEKAEQSGCLKIENGLKLFGAQSRPLPKLLRNSYDPFIPGVTGNFRGATEFLKSLNLCGREGKNKIMLDELSNEESKKLGNAILNKCPHTNKNKIFGDIYIVKGEEGPFRDAREFATILNACGRLESSTVGIAACLGDKKMKKKAMEIQDEYKKELQAILSWFKKNKDSENVFMSNKYIIINGKHNVPSSMAGTFASIIAYSEEVDDKAFILTLSRLENDFTKVSIRLKGRSSKVDLNSIISKIVSSVGGQSGGHSNAAGALIETENEKDFIEAAKRVFEEYSIVEDII
ncbi:MAG: DHH family phosphoesterase [Candidatus Nanoarchaeia archaeon]